MDEGVLEGETERKLGGCIWKGEGKTNRNRWSIIAVDNMVREERFGERIER